MSIEQPNLESEQPKPELQPEKGQKEVELTEDVIRAIKRGREFAVYGARGEYIGSNEQRYNCLENWLSSARTEEELKQMLDKIISQIGESYAEHDYDHLTEEEALNEIFEPMLLRQFLKNMKQKQGQ